MEASISVEASNERRGFYRRGGFYKCGGFYKRGGGARLLISNSVFKTKLETSSLYTLNSKHLVLRWAKLALP